MQKNTRNHIRTLLWNYKDTEKVMNNISDVVSNRRVNFSIYPLEEEMNHQLSMNQIIFNRIFLDTVNSILDDSTTEIKDVFTSKYFYGYPSKENALVAHEISLSESTIKRRDNELLREIAIRLGWS